MLILDSARQTRAVSRKRGMRLLLVIPAQAGIHFDLCGNLDVHSGSRRNDGYWIPGHAVTMILARASIAGGDRA